MNRIDKKLQNKKPTKNNNNNHNDIEEAIFEVEDIIQKKKVGNKIMYLVKWKGYDDSENTWEPKTNLIKDLGKQYLDEVDDRLNKKK